MRNLILICILYLFSCSAMAASITCIKKIATLVDEKKSIETNVGEKLALFKKNGNTVYITETKPSFFAIELFMSDEEQRIYSEGHLDSENSLSLSVWNRDTLIEISCQNN